MYFVYIIYSPSKNRFYVGFTNNLEDAIRRHNNKRSGYRKFTRQASDWELKYYESFKDKSEALKREKEIKKKKSRKYLIKLIQLNKQDHAPSFINSGRRRCKSCPRNKLNN
ncbi:MAG: GIY-YIG nuclease family protein [Candidatus Pacearchaeota archaeon]